MSTVCDAPVASTSTSTTDMDMDMLVASPRTPAAARPSQELRIEAGMAATPVGPMAEEFKFFCPLCMMFYRGMAMREMPCCRQHVCSFCLKEFVRTKQPPPATDETGVATCGSSAPSSKEIEGHVRLPKGMACPHCASVGDGRPLRLLDSREEARSYQDSPNTSADLARVSSLSMRGSGFGSGMGMDMGMSMGGQRANSPLKVGDDFATMTRKLLPFK